MRADQENGVSSVGDQNPRDKSRQALASQQFKRRDGRGEQRLKAAGRFFTDNAVSGDRGRDHQRHHHEHQHGLIEQINLHALVGVHAFAGGQKALRQSAVLGGRLA